MGLGFSIHHILTQAALAAFGDDIAALFGPGAVNPFAVEATHNKMPLFHDLSLAAAMQQLTADGRNPFEGLFGDAAHPWQTPGVPSDHPGLNAFQNAILDQIFDPENGLTDPQKILALQDLADYSRLVGEAGHPPIATGTVEDFMNDYGIRDEYGMHNRVKPAYIDAHQSELAARFNEVVDSYDPTKDFDVNKPGNFEMRVDTVKTAIQVALDTNSLPENIRADFQNVLNALNDPSVNPNVMTSGAISDLGQRHSSKC